MEDDFSNAPISITEHKANKEEDGSLWTPRDCLIAALRELDSGRLKAEACVVVLKEISPEGNTKARFFRQGKDLYESLGLLERVKFVMQER